MVSIRVDSKKRKEKKERKEKEIDSLITFVFLFRLDGAEKDTAFDFLMAIGDDTTDEDMHRRLAHHELSYTVKVCFIVHHCNITLMLNNSFSFFFFLFFFARTLRE